MEFNRPCYGKYENAEDAQSAFKIIIQHRNCFGTGVSCPMSGDECLPTCLFYKEIRYTDDDYKVGPGVFPARCINPMFAKIPDHLFDGGREIGQLAQLSEYQEEIDSFTEARPGISRFIEQCCEVAEDERTPFSDLYDAFLHWSGNTADTVNRKWFAKEIQRRFKKIASDKVYFSGLKLKSSYEAAPSVLRKFSLWDQFVYELVGRSFGIFSYLQVLIGYALLEKNYKEHILVVFHCPAGDTMARLFFEVIETIVGPDLVLKIDFNRAVRELKNSSLKLSEEIPKLKGKRIAYDSECITSINDFPIQYITSGEQIHYRDGKEQQFKSITFEFLSFLFMEAYPEIPKDDLARRERIRIIETCGSEILPFFDISSEENLAGFRTTLLSDRQGISRWIQEGKEKAVNSAISETLPVKLN